MIFVHSRKDTVKTAQVLRDMAAKKGLTQVFKPDDMNPRWLTAQAQMQKSKNRELRVCCSSFTKNIQFMLFLIAGTISGRVRMPQRRHAESRPQPRRKAV